MCGLQQGVLYFVTHSVELMHVSQRHPDSAAIHNGVVTPLRMSHMVRTALIRVATGVWSRSFDPRIFWLQLSRIQLHASLELFAMKLAFVGAGVALAQLLPLAFVQPLRAMWAWSAGG